MAVQGALWLAKHHPSTLLSVFITGFHYLSYKQLLSYPHEAEWTPFLILYSAWAARQVT